jgi:hypothetical protein
MESIIINSQLNINRQESLKYFTACHEQLLLFYVKEILKRGKRLVNEYPKHYHNTFLHKKILNCWKKKTTGVHERKWNIETSLPFRKPPFPPPI